MWYYLICIYIYITNFELLDSTRPIQQVSLKPKMVSLQTRSIQVCAEWILPKPLKLLKKTAAPIEPLNCERLSVHIPALPRPGIESHILRWEHDILLGCILRSCRRSKAIACWDILFDLIIFTKLFQTENSCVDNHGTEGWQVNIQMTRCLRLWVDLIEMLPQVSLEQLF